jgi:hypothetical protein
MQIFKSAESSPLSSRRDHYVAEKGAGGEVRGCSNCKIFRKSHRVNLTLNPSPQGEGLEKLLILSKIFTPLLGERGRG